MASKTYEDIITLLGMIRDKLDEILAGARINPKQITIVEGLSEISTSLGVVQAGEFRTGNGNDPGYGFSGMRMAYPQMTYNGEEWNLVGVNNDVLQFGVDAASGGLTAGSGAVRLDINGIVITADEQEIIDSVSDARKISFIDSSGSPLLETFAYHVNLLPPNDYNMAAIRYSNRLWILPTASQGGTQIELQDGLDGPTADLRASIGTNSQTQLRVRGENFFLGSDSRVEISSSTGGSAATTKLLVDGIQVPMLFFEVELNRGTALTTGDKCYRRIPAWADGYVLSEVAAMIKSSGAYATGMGAGATDRSSVATYGYTRIMADNPAASNGTITSVELWFNTNATGVKVGTFSKNGLDFTPRSSTTIGNVTSGSKKTFSGLSLDVVSGDYIGIYWATGTAEYDTSGYAGYYWKAGDQFDAGVQTYAFTGSGPTMSVKGIVTRDVVFTIKNGATSMMSANPTIEGGDYDTMVSSQPGTIDTANDDVATGDQIEIGVSAAGDSVTYAVVQLAFQKE